MNILFDVYDNLGGVTVGDTAVTVGLNTTKVMNSLCSLGSNEITKSAASSIIQPYSDYSIYLSAKITVNATSGNDRSQSKSWIEMDSGSGYEVIPGTYCYGYNRNNAEGYCSMVMNTTVVVNKKSPSKFRLRVQRSSGTNTIQTVADASSFIGLVGNVEF